MGRIEINMATRVETLTELSARQAEQLTAMTDHLVAVKDVLDGVLEENEVLALYLGEMNTRFDNEEKTTERRWRRVQLPLTLLGLFLAALAAYFGWAAVDAAKNQPPPIVRPVFEVPPPVVVTVPVAPAPEPPAAEAPPAEAPPSE